MPATLKTKYEGIQRAMNKFNVIRVGDDTMLQHQKHLFFFKRKDPTNISHIYCRVTFSDHSSADVRTATHYMT